MKRGVRPKISRSQVKLISVVCKLGKMNKIQTNPIKKESGFIYGFTSTRLFPSLWLGLIPPKPNQKYRDDTRKKLNKVGQFFIWHPYQGSVCDLVSLHGIFLPLTTCRRQEIKNALGKLQKKYYKHPFTSVRPNLDEVLTVRNELRTIGPLDMSYHFREMGEGYIPFQVSETTYTWLRSNFEMMTFVLDTEDDDRGYRQLEVVETRSLGWNTLSEFTDWFFSANWSLTEENIRTHLSGAFIYPNSDGCDNFGFIEGMEK